jgi:translation initiation factor IF-1
LSKEKEEFTVQGKIIEALPGAEFVVELQEEGMQGHKIRAHVSGKMRMNYIRILPGDVVTIVMTPYDLTKGRITYRDKDGGRSN